MENSKNNNVKKESTNTNKAKSTKMSISNKGVKFIAGFEGCRLSAYKCPAGVWTIGYGHTKNVKEGDRLASEEEARKLLKKDLKTYEGYVNQLIDNKSIRFQVNQNMFDALTSFVYNCGAGNLATLVKNRDATAVADALLLYCKAAGKELPGLKRRREEERKLFLKK